MAILIFTNCDTKTNIARRSPTESERALPFTGTWRSSGPDSILELYQEDARTISGMANALPIVGSIQGDGMLTLAISRNTSVEMLILRKERDTLVLERRLNSHVGEAPSVQKTWTRN